MIPDMNQDSSWVVVKKKHVYYQIFWDSMIKHKLLLVYIALYTLRLDWRIAMFIRTCLTFRTYKRYWKYYKTLKAYFR